MTASNAYTARPAARSPLPYLAALLLGCLCISLLGTAPALAFDPEDVKTLLENNKCRDCDLSGADLSGKILNWADLRGADLSGAQLVETRLNNADLRGTNFAGANLHGALLTTTLAQGASFKGADLRLATLARSTLTNVDFTDAKFERTRMAATRIEGAIFDGTDPAGIYR